MGIIAISCYYHDSAAALINDAGEIIAAVQEERLSRIKHDSDFPFSSVCFCVEEAKKNSINIDKIVYYEKPIIVFGRLLETYFETAPRGLSSFIPAMKTWISEKLFIKQNILNELSHIIPDFNE